MIHCRLHLLKDFWGERVLNTIQDKEMLGYMNKFLRIFREKGSDMWEIAGLRKSNGTVIY